MNLSLKDTQELKGIAILMLVAHHLFLKPEYGFDDIQLAGIGAVNSIGILCKACVALFVFLSGYGIFISESKKDNPFILRHYYLHRLSKLMINYWYVGFIFVLIDVLFFRSPTDVYQHALLPHALLDLLGLSRIVGAASFNPTWWFITCILFLYLIAPLVNWLIKKRCVTLLLCISFVLSWLPFTNWQQTVGPYLFVFSLGMVLGSVREKEIVPNNKVWIIGVAVFLLVASIERLLCDEFCVAQFFDGIISIILVFLFKLFQPRKVFATCLSFLGKHSMDIFLFHTFLLIWFKGLIYSLKNPVIIYIIFFSVCLVIAIGLGVSQKVA